MDEHGLLHPAAFIEPCLPCQATKPPAGPSWIHEIKHDGYRIMARRDANGRVQLLTRKGNDFSRRFPRVVAAVAACCARAASGHVAAAPPRNVMNSRRFMSRPLRSRTSYHIVVCNAALCITTQSDPIARS